MFEQHPILETRNLTIGYGNCPVVRDVSFSLNKGEVFALIGPNGAGKSTLLKAISGVLPTLSGSVWVNGKNITSLSERARARKLAVVPQARSLPAGFTVYQTILMGRTAYLDWFGSPGAKDDALVRSAMEQARISHLEKRHVDTLSGGEQQRVLLARALAQDTPALLLDEPTTHLDLQHQAGLLNLVRELACERDLCVFVVLHDLNWASLYADRVGLLLNGQLHSVGTPDNVLTSELLSFVYQIPVKVVPHPDYGTPLVLPDGVYTTRHLKYPYPVSSVSVNG